MDRSRWPPTPVLVALVTCRTASPAPSRRGMQTVPVRTPELSVSFEQATLARPRLRSVDLLRGLVMVLMALDHVRVYFSSVREEPVVFPAVSPGFFLARWVPPLGGAGFGAVGGRRRRSRVDQR